MLIRRTVLHRSNARPGLFDNVVRAALALGVAAPLLIGLQAADRGVRADPAGPFAADFDGVTRPHVWSTGSDVRREAALRQLPAALLPGVMQSAWGSFAIPSAMPAFGQLLPAPQAPAGCAADCARRAEPADAPSAAASALARRLSREETNVARFVAAKYRVTVDAVADVVGHAFDTARKLRVDPHLVLAVISIESNFDVEARSEKGAQGLMQVLTRMHRDKFAPFGGVSAAFDPIANISVGTQILREYLSRDGSEAGALKAYVGAALMPDDGGYGNKVLSERARIAAAAAGRPIPVEPLVVKRAQVVASSQVVELPPVPPVQIGSAAWLEPAGRAALNADVPGASGAAREAPAADALVTQAPAAEAPAGTLAARDGEI